MRYTFRSRVGLMEIEQDEAGRWHLLIDGETLSFYQTPEGAAEDVASQMTGHNGWDDGPRPAHPLKLSEWQKGN